MPVVSTTRPARISRPSPSATPRTRPGAVEHQILGRPFDNVESVDLGEDFRHRAAVQLAVGLGARAPHRRSLAAVQHAELDAGPVDRAAHDAVERVDLAHQMALGEPADRRVARHLADRRARMRQQRRARAQPRRRRGRLAPGMAAADHDDIVGSADFVHGGANLGMAAPTVEYRASVRYAACPHNSALASRAPSARAFSLTQTTLG